MTFTLSTTGLSEVFAVVLLASFLQTLLGFGFGMLSLPLLILIGLPLPEAICLVLCCSFLQSTNAARHYRKDVDIDLALKASVFRVLFMPLGAIYLHLLENIDPALSRRWAGAAILFMLTLRLLPNERLYFLRSKIFAYIAWGMSGFMGTSIGVGAPPIVVWANLQNWKPEKVRAFILTVFLSSMVPGLAFLTWKFPDALPPTLKRVLICIPAIFIGFMVGKRYAKKLPSHVLEKLILALLFISSIKLIFDL